MRSLDVLVNKVKAIYKLHTETCMDGYLGRRMEERRREGEPGPEVEARAASRLL